MYINVVKASMLNYIEAATGGAQSKKVLLKISQYSQKSTCVGIEKTTI